MFWYVFSIDGRTPDSTTDPDDIRVIEDRGQALAYMKILGFKPRVVMKLPLDKDTHQ
jgi:hypothetical protein